MNRNLLSFYILILTFSLIYKVNASNSPLMLEELAQDNIELKAFAYDQMNPLRRILRPEYNENSFEYEYHAWSEVNEEGVYPVYVWELISDANGIKEVELARYWDDKNTLDKSSFYKELDDTQREVLLYNLKNNVLRGGLTKTKLKSESDTKRFYLISTRVIDFKEKLIPSFLPPTTSIEPVVTPEKESPALIVDPTVVEKNVEKKKEEPSVKMEDAPKPGKDLKYGIPVPGNKKYIYSPAPGGVDKKWIIDIQDYRPGAAEGSVFAPGTKVGDPYTGEVILVP